jgi:hypothetical protein
MKDYNNNINIIKHNLNNNNSIKISARYETMLAGIEFRLKVM